ncbi:MAG: oligoendopeptidase F [Clostridia bacterium]|nr:oligoendopeptidase F [Clostridia bacterium]
MRKNKILVLALVFVLIISSQLYGCQNNANGGNEPTSNNVTNEAGVNNKASEEVNSENNINNTAQNDTEEVVETEDPEEEIPSGPQRSDIPEEYKWDLEKVYANTDAFMADVNKVKDSFKFFADAEADFTKSLDSFLNTLKQYEEIRRVTDKVYVFATLQAHTDTANTDFSDLEDITAELDTSLTEATSYFMPAIIDIDDETLEIWLAADELKDYRSFIEDIINDRDHILSESEEEILAQAQILFEVPESIYDAFNYLTDFSDYLPEPDWNKFWSGSREDKKDALEAYYAKSAAGINLLSEIYESEIKKNTFFAEARNYDSALESALDTDGMTLEAYDKVFDITHDNLDKLHHWISLKKEILGIEDQVHIYDLYSPLIDNPYSFIDYEPGKEIIFEALKPLGQKYIDDLKEGFDSRWADVYTTEGKYEGGYQWGTYDTDPFVLLNFYGLMTDVSTVAHEMGHALNFKYSNENQNYFTSGVPIFNAEIASTTNESMVFEYRVKTATTKTEKQQALLNYIELIENTIFTQMIYADFEKRAYEAYEAGEPLSADVFNEIMGEVYQEYYGEDFAIDEITTYQWAEIPHFYNAFYVYKYATGLSAGLSFSNQVINGDKEDVQKYLDFLKAGSSAPPLQLLKTAGVDFSTGEPLQLAFDKFEELVKEFEETLK